MGMRNGSMHKLPPCSAGATLCSLPTYSTVSPADPQRCSTPTRGKLCQIWPRPDAKAGGAPPYVAWISLREIYTPLRIFNFPTSGSYGYPSTTAHSFDLLIPFVAHYEPFDAPEPLLTSTLCGWGYQHRCC